MNCMKTKLFLEFLIGYSMTEEVLILKDQNGQTIKVTEEQYKANKDLFDSIINDNRIDKPSWLRKEPQEK